MLQNYLVRKPDFEILVMQSDDCADVSHLHGQRFSRAWNDGEFLSLLLQPNVFGFVARQTNAFFKTPITGFVLARALAGEAEILTVTTAEKIARCGLGWRLMQAAMREAVARDAETMFLEVDDGNHPALGLYRKLGFEKAGERPAYYTDARGLRSTALVMKRDLR